MTMPGARLPFGFARRFGVMLDTSSTPATLLLRTDTPLTALAEAQRWAGRAVSVCTLTDAQFSERLASSYSAGQSAAEQVAQGLDDELDLMSLAEQVPQTADLLEQEGDAPIIRLINALLREAMREKASARCINGFCSGPLPRDDQSRSRLASYKPLPSLKRSATTSSASLSAEATCGSRTLAQ